MKAKSLRSAFIATSATLLAVASAIPLTVTSAYADTPMQNSADPQDSTSGAKESTGQMIDDTAITTKVKSAFVRDQKVSALDISVKSDNGIVQLSGFANSAQEADRAAELARQVPGVKEVQNNIELKSSSSSESSPKSQY
ncbi:MAG: BON domain-containing protein [Rhodocyclaceae bacterium]|nr:BON domain-containing protein [Rhodocyclaceae bacterium]